MKPTRLFVTLYIGVALTACSTTSPTWLCQTRLMPINRDSSAVSRPANKSEQPPLRQNPTAQPGP